jgi:hypothetical protein
MGRLRAHQQRGAAQPRAVRDAGDQLPARVPDDAGFPPLVNKRQFVPPKDMLAEPKP